MINVPRLLDTDTYKLGHSMMYPKDAVELKAYFTLRGPLTERDHRIAYWGIRYLYDTVISKPITQSDIDKADEYIKTHGVAKTAMKWPKNLWQKIVDNHNGYIPVEIKSLREGSVVLPQVPCFTITARKGSLEGEEFQFLCTYLETALMRIWSPIVTATKSAKVYDFLNKMFEESVDEENHFLLSSRLHDFGSRGVSSSETAMWTGAAHLTSFEGTDTLTAGWLATKYNNGNPVGESVIATEHSVMTSYENEVDAVKQAIAITEPGGICSVVADSYSYDNFLNNILPEIVPFAKEQGVLFVIRPDSGDPVDCVIRGLESAAKHFGYVINSKGYKVITGAAVIQGDGIDLSKLMEIAQSVKENGFSAQCVAYGMGGGLLQKQNRDTLKAAIKLCRIENEDGSVRDIMKKPSDDISKTSLPGSFCVNYVDGIPQVYPSDSAEDYRLEIDALQTIWNCGPVDYNWETFDQVRARLRKNWVKCPAVTDQVLSHQMIEKLKFVSSQIAQKYSM